jgi:predicted nuclease with TOPRIM domain
VVNYIERLKNEQHHSKELTEEKISLTASLEKSNAENRSYIITIDSLKAENVNLTERSTQLEKRLQLQTSELNELKKSQVSLFIFSHHHHSENIHRTSFFAFFWNMKIITFLKKTTKSSK